MVQNGLIEDFIVPLRLWILFIARHYLPEVGKAQLEAQSLTSAVSAIAEVALRSNFLF